MLEEHEVNEWPVPDWADDLDLIAAAVDLVSHRRFRVWYDPAEANRQVGRLRRARRQPLLVESVEVGVAIARLPSWADVVSWHDAEVISAGWLMLKQFPEPEEETASDPLRGSTSSQPSP